MSKEKVLSVSNPDVRPQKPNLCVGKIMPDRQSLPVELSHTHNASRVTYSCGMTFPTRAATPSPLKTLAKTLSVLSSAATSSPAL